MEVAQTRVRAFVEELRQKVQSIRADPGIGPIYKVSLLEELKKDYLIPLSLNDPLSAETVSGLLEDVETYVNNPELLI